MSASTDNTAPVIRFSEVHKSFGEKQILSGFSMELEKGRTLAIMGPSGVGKSVTLKHAIGILTPDAGSVEVFGQEISQTTSKELAEMRKRMGYVFQEGALINWLSVGDNVALPLRENTDLEEDEIRERVQRRLELVHIPDAWELMPSEISGGMKKRVGIARALITDPELILYDEPNAGLDPEIARSINALIRERKKRKCTFRKAQLLYAYSKLVGEGALAPCAPLAALLVKKSSKSQSGVLVITVLTSPYPKFGNRVTLP